MNIKTYEQIKETYRRMTREAKYHPAAPSDGFGNITIPASQIDVEADADKYAHHWWEWEEAQDYWVGCPDWAGRPALIYLIEAARAANGVDFTLAAKLCRMASKELDRLSKERGNFPL